jgi:hypothetical protein
MGHYMLSISTELEAAIVGHRFVYLGGAYIPVLMMFAVMKLCHIKIPKWFGTMMMVFATIVFYFALDSETKTFALIFNKSSDSI